MHQIQDNNYINMIKHRLLLLLFYHYQVECETCETFDGEVWSVETQGVVAVWASLTGGLIIFSPERKEEL